MRNWTDENNCMPKANVGYVGDEAFFSEDFLTYYRTHGIKECPCGARTPWPNRAETAVRLFKRQWQLMTKSLEDDRFKEVTIREAIKRTVWARNTQLTISGYSPLEIATGRRPPDLLDIETSDPAQLSVEPLAEDRTQQELQRLALRAHQEARQSQDLRHDMAKRTMPSDGPYKPGDKVFVWSAPANANSISHKALKKERWIRGTVISQEGSMVNVHVDNAVMRVNQSKSDVIMMSGMMLLCLDLTIQILFHLQLKTRNNMNQVLLKAIVLKHTMVNRNIGFVKLASAMWLNCAAATPVLVG